MNVYKQAARQAQPYEHGRSVEPPSSLPQRGMNATTDYSQWEAIVVEEAAEYYSYNSIDLAAFVLVLFEYLITFDSEVECAWRRKLTWARLILLLNRYIALVLFFVSITPLISADNLPSTTNGPHRCEALNYTMQTATVILYGVWSAFSGLRIYAISHNNRPITVLVVLLSLVPVATNIYLEVLMVDSYTEGTGCVVSSNFSQTVWRRVCSVAYEGIIVAVTWIKTWKAVRADPIPGIPKSVTAFVLHEGILYFAVIMVLNAIQLAFIWVEADTLSLTLQFLNPLTSILISRFYFGLAKFRREEEASSLPSQSSGPATTIRFGRESDMYETDSEISFGNVVFEKVVSTPLGRSEF
ncbi:hypothetical protein GY45DRAFT_1370291 [Cubamyces sp. BRFM 1775]|nr:hypothetical protein GY45DRAFT_1370291 [Cubamyces sp. BRFM 1775]